MAKKGAREIVALICSVCKNQNYGTTRNKVNMDVKGKGKLGLKKYCRYCKKVQLHKESSKLNSNEIPLNRSLSRERIVPRRRKVRMRGSQLHKKSSKLK